MSRIIDTEKLLNVFARRNTEKTFAISRKDSSNELYVGISTIKLKLFK